MPSVQASLWNLFARNVIKSRLSATDGIGALRSMTARMDQLCPDPRGAQIIAAPLANCRAEWIVPDGLAASDRIVLYVPGGGFASCAPKGSRLMGSRIARAASARALLVFYRLAPENPYPRGLTDVLAAYDRLLSEGCRPDRIVFGGDSAGAALVCAALLALRDDGSPLPAGAFTVSAITDLTDHERGSRRTNASLDPMLPGLAHGAMDSRMLYVGGDAALLTNPYVSPLFGNFSGLPPLLLQVGSTEVLLDDSVTLAEKARADGVDAEVEVWEGVPHVWHAAAIPEARRAIGHISDFVRRCCP